MKPVDDLVILTYADYVQLRRTLKAAGIDLCYMAQAAQPVRLDWSARLFQDDKFLQQVAERRPADSDYRIASVWHAKKGGWLRPDEFMVTFHGVGALQEAAFMEYLATHPIKSSPEASRARLVRGAVHG